MGVGTQGETNKLKEVCDILDESFVGIFGTVTDTNFKDLTELLENLEVIREMNGYTTVSTIYRGVSPWNYTLTYEVHTNRKPTGEDLTFKFEARHIEQDY